MATLRQHQDANLVLLNAALQPRVTAYPIDKVPNSRPHEYAEVMVSEVYTDPDDLLLDATTNVQQYRVTVWWLSRHSANNALTIRDKCFGALRFARLVVDGVAHSPAQFEGTEQDIESDDGWFVGSASFIY